MPVLPRRSALRRLLIAALALGLAPVAAEAAPGWRGHAAGPRHAAAKRAAAGRPAAPKPAPAAKPEPREAARTAPAKAAPGKRTGTWTSGEGERACFRSRRKLWQEGQGWVVKKVSVCP